MKFHLYHKKAATVTAVNPPVRFGELELRKSSVKKFSEKRQIRNSWISGGYFIFKKLGLNLPPNLINKFNSNNQYPLGIELPKIIELMKKKGDI